MTETGTETPTVVVERELAFSPEKVWRVLTLPQLIEEWLVKNDFMLAQDHRFDLDFEWGGVACRVLDIEPYQKLSYTWVSGQLESIVTWTLTATNTGTRLRMEQKGFPSGEPRYYYGAKMGWPKFFDGIEQTLTRLEKMQHIPISGDFA